MLHGGCGKFHGRVNDVTEGEKVKDIRGSKSLEAAVESEGTVNQTWM